MSIGTKLIPNLLLQFDEIIKKLKSENIQFFTHPVKDNKKFKLMLFWLPKIDIKSIANEFKHCFNIELENIKEIQTSRSNDDDTQFNGDSPLNSNSPNVSLLK